MALTSPNLDDRTFEQLLDEAKRLVAKSCPEWNDLSPSDPGVVLLELFAYLTDTMIYRLNRLPEKAYIEFLRLMGVKLHPPSAASVMLTFVRTRLGAVATEGGGDEPMPRIEIPRNTRVTLSRSGASKEAPVFLTSRTAVFEPAKAEIEVLAFHCEQIDAELVGHGVGLPGQSVVVSRPPIIAASGDEQNLIVGIEATLEEIGTARSREYGGKAFRVWKETDNFIDIEDDRYVYMVDRNGGRITFAPALETFKGEKPAPRAVALASSPEEGREIRIWYRRGGGVDGNVAANTLTLMKDPIAGVSVTNHNPATGGRSAETLANALVRGPHELNSHKYAITTRDYEQIACSSGAVERARAFTKAQLWKHAEPGTVQVLLVPELPQTENIERLTVDELSRHHTEEATREIREMLDERRPLGTTVLVHWIRYKVVRVKARIIVFRGEDGALVAARVRKRLDQMICPLRTPEQPGGWPFDQPLQVGRVYGAIFKEPGVKNVDGVRLLVDDVPSQPVPSIAADHFQPSTWHVISGNALFRSVDDAQGWERIPELPDMEPDEEVRLIRTHPGRPGWTVAITRRKGEEAGASAYLSDDCSETWRVLWRSAFEITDVAWILRGDTPALLIAGTAGLYELAIAPGASVQKLVVGDLPQDLGFWAVAVMVDIRGQPVNVAVAAWEKRGVWVSYEAGRSKSFVSLELKDEDVRALLVQYDGSRSFLWAGVAAERNQPGRGCFRWGGPNEPWQPFSTGWRGGSCYRLAVSSSKLLAATFDGGVLSLDTTKRAEAAQWQSPAAECGLPRGENNRQFIPVRALAAAPHGPVVLAGGDRGVFRSSDGGATYQFVSSNEFSDSLSLPETSLFCSGGHELTVVGEDEL
jgi:Baseplate J-like protein